MLRILGLSKMTEIKITIDSLSMEIQRINIPTRYYFFGKGDEAVPTSFKAHAGSEAFGSCLIFK